MSALSIDQLKTRIGITVGIIVVAVLCLCGLGVATKVSAAAGGGNGAEFLLGVSLQQSLPALLLCLLIVTLTSLLFRRLDTLKEAQLTVEGPKAELAIKAAQIDAANDSILQIDEEGRLIYFNQALCRLTEYAGDELAGMRLQEIEPPEYACRFEAIMAGLRESKEATFESAYLTKGGAAVPVEVHSRLLESEGETQVLAIARDITERKRREQRERCRQSTLERIATDAALDELLGCVVRYVEQEIPGSLCSVLLVDESGTRLRHGAAPSLPDAYNHAVSGLRIGKGKGACGTATFLRQRVVVEDLESHPCWSGFRPAREAGLAACWSEPVFASNGILLGTLAVYHREPRAPGSDDLGLMEAAAQLAAIAIGRVRADEGRRVLEEQLRHSQKIEAVGQLAAGVAHDFNNLLTPIIVYADMLLQYCPAGSTQARMVDSMSQAAQKAGELTQKLLSFGRKQALHVELLDLNEVILSFRDILRATARDNLSIDLRLSPGAVKVQADRGQLEQVLLNLLLNAQDAIEGTGSICVETGHLILDEEFHKAHPVAKPGHYILLAFSDDGCGMAEETLRHMYEPFFTTKETGRGTGLGLATVYGIVKRHGGCIDVKSRPGEGTRFGIYLPASSSSADPVMPPPSRPAIPSAVGKGKTILLVEDNAMIREVTYELLTSFGYAVLAAESPSRALQLAKEQRTIDLLATDVVMPEMTGPELYEKLLENYPGLPVLYISGYSAGLLPLDENQRQDAIFLAKPFTLEQFMARIGEMLGSDLLLAVQVPLDHEAMERLIGRSSPRGND